ncbi:hypothetical protein N9009_02050, partial [bacterium]|nr:hypothetical protein [bacterium]
IGCDNACQAKKRAFESGTLAGFATFASGFRNIIKEFEVLSRGEKYGHYLPATKRPKFHPFNEALGTA